MMRIVIILIFCIYINGCAQGCDSQYGCHAEFVVGSVDLVGSNSLEAIAFISTAQGDVYAMVGKCAYGNLPGSTVKVRYFDKVPPAVKFEVHSLGGADLVPAEVVSKKISSKISGDLMQYSGLIMCY